MFGAVVAGEGSAAGPGGTRDELRPEVDRGGAENPGQRETHRGDPETTRE